jgi:hypothetical protein
MAYKMLTETCYFKTGREGVVFEATDHLRPNLFDDNGNIENSIFHKGSKIRFTLIDARKTQGKGKAIYYNLDPNEILLLSYLLSDGNSAHFKKRVGAYNNLSGQEQLSIRQLTETFWPMNFARFDKLMDYSKNTEGTAVTLQKNIGVGEGKLLVRKLTISYEEAMRSSSKWKITIEEGEALKDSSKGNGLNIIKSGTYKTINKTHLLLQVNEIVVPIVEAAKRVTIAQIPFYLLMKKAQENFTVKKLENSDYTGEKIDEWNPEGKVKVFDKKEEKRTGTKNDKADIKSEKSIRAVDEKNCSECGVKIDNNVYNYSMKIYKKPLCFNCQKKHKK